MDLQQKRSEIFSAAARPLAHHKSPCPMFASSNKIRAAMIIQNTALL